MVQIGGRTPERIPDIGDTGEIIGWRTDGRGKPLTTQLSAEGEAQLSTIASATGGRLIRAEKGTTGIETIAGELRRQMESDYGEKVETVYADVYFYPLGLAILLLVAEVFLGEAPRRSFVRRAPPQGRPAVARRPVRPGPAAPWVARRRGAGAERAARADTLQRRGRRGGPGGRPCDGWRKAAVASVSGALIPRHLAAGGCSGWDPTSPFERNSPEVEQAVNALDAGEHRAAEEILERYLGTGECSDGGISVPDTVKRKADGSFDLGLTLFGLAESFGEPFGDEEEPPQGQSPDPTHPAASSARRTLVIDATPRDAQPLSAGARLLPAATWSSAGPLPGAVKLYERRCAWFPPVARAVVDDVGADAAVTEPLPCGGRTERVPPRISRNPTGNGRLGSRPGDMTAAPERRRDYGPGDQGTP